ncbi:hypothetical protein C8C89_4828 [Janthinobacterium sp. 75]|nr:hypothetical protein C8C89_4828 [Janthinobacterium sp. 75]
MIAYMPIDQICEHLTRLSSLRASKSNAEVDHNTKAPIWLKTVN